MKKTAIIFLMFLFGAHFAEAQNKKIFVSRQGGTKKLLTFGKNGYNLYHFNNSSDKCDTLICRGSGFETCKIDKNIFKMNKTNSEYYVIYNRAIRASVKQISRDKKNSGQFNLILDKNTLLVKYSHADKKGNADIEIEIL